MTTYNDDFGQDTVSIANGSYAQVTLSANTQFYWPELEDSQYVITSILDVSASGTYKLLLPGANGTSVGRSFLLRNTGAETFTVADAGGSDIVSMASGDGRILFVLDNDTAAGEWAVVSLGISSSGAEASALAGLGLEAADNKLRQTIGSRLCTTNTSVELADRARALIFDASGSITATLMDAATAGNFFVHVSNQGTGSVTLDPYLSQLIDGATTKAIAPGESATIVCDGARWVTIGYGRSTTFQFTKLVKDVSSGTPFTLTSTEAANKLVEFIGTLTGNVIVNVPATVAIYYTQCSFTGAYTCTVKTASGTGVALAANERAILYCDGTNVVAAQTAGAPTSNLSGGAAGSVVYQQAPDATGFTGVGTTGQVLTSAGTGSPYWSSSIAGNAATATTAGNVTGTVAIANGGTGSTTAANARTALGVPSMTGTGASGTWGISISGSAATASSAATLSGTVAVANGGTGATTAPNARTNLGVPSTTGTGASGSWGISVTGTSAGLYGDFSNATPASRGRIQTTTTNGVTSIPITPNGTSPWSQIAWVNSSSVANCGALFAGIDNAAAHILSGVVGSGSHLPLLIGAGGNYHLQIGTTGTFTVNANSLAATIPLAVYSSENYGSIALDMKASAAQGLSVMRWVSNDYNTSYGAIEGGSSGLQYYAYGSQIHRWVTNAATRMTLRASGHLSVGSGGGGSYLAADDDGAVSLYSASAPLRLRHTSSAGGKLWQIGPNSDNNLTVANQGGVGVYVVDGNTSWAALSDERKKDIIEPIASGLANISGWRAVIGKYKADPEGTRRAFLVAQDVQKTRPEAVDTTDPERLGLRYTEVIPDLVAAINELHGIVKKQQERIDALERAINAAD